MSGPRIVVCGAGIAGLATAHYLALRPPRGGAQVELIDRHLPMSLTTSKSGENFRELWPQACMTALMRRSLDLMQQLADAHGAAFRLSYSGYDFVSGSAEREVLPRWELGDAEWSGAVTRITDVAQIRRDKPYLANDIQQVVHIERAGAIDVQALGQSLLRLARGAGVVVRRGTVAELRRRGSGFDIDIAGDRERMTLGADIIVLAAGPFVGSLANVLGLELPVENIVQRKIVIPDPAGHVPRDMPFTIYADPQRLAWSDEERELLGADAEHRWLLEEFPAGLHIKPEGGGQIKLGWAFNRVAEAPSWDIDDDPAFPDVVVRGASRFIPSLAEYVARVPTPVYQYAGYYTRTRENWPIIGPLDEGVFTVAALSGFGTMAACGAGELCADWVRGEVKQSYARHFHPRRYDDAAIMTEIESLASDGQL